MRLSCIFSARRTRVLYNSKKHRVVKERLMNRKPALISYILLALGILTLALPAALAQTAPATVYVKAGHLFDATSDNLRDNMVLIVEGERIAKVAPVSEVTIPAGAMVVDLSQAWVLPGLIDCHTHLEARADH
jgi:hypothetical protein